jgi:hypothetical protein
MKQIWANTPCHEGEPLASAWTPAAGDFQPPQDLMFVPSGNAALTRRLISEAPFEVMVKSQRRGLSQRWGFLVRREALQAAQQALADTELQRARQREVARRRRAAEEAAYQATFGSELRRQFPGVPIRAVNEIVAHATRVGSRRVGRSQQLGLAERVSLAVQAYIRHRRSGYEDHLAAGMDREDARDRASSMVERVLT